MNDATKLGAFSKCFAELLGVADMQGGVSSYSAAALLCLAGACTLTW
jgi:hypothetical protein